MPTSELNYAKIRERQRRSLVLTWDNREDDMPLDPRKRRWRRRQASEGQTGPQRMTLWRQVERPNTIEEVGEYVLDNNKYEECRT